LYLHYEVENAGTRRERRRKVATCTASAVAVARPKAAAVASAGRETASVKRFARCVDLGVSRSS
jgi:hypothetical protein